jgi:hypothetical protein
MADPRCMRAGRKRNHKTQTRENEIMDGDKLRSAPARISQRTATDRSTGQTYKVSEAHRCRAAESQRAGSDRLRNARLTARAVEGPSVCETALASQQHGAALKSSARARQHHAGLKQNWMDTRKQGVKVMPERLEASLGSFGTNPWAQKAEPHAPRLATTTQLSYGIVAVPNWSKSVGAHDPTLDTVDPHGQGVWLGTRYSKPQAKPAWTQGPRGPPDPRMAKWRGNPPEPRGPNERPAHETEWLANRAARKAESKELDELRQMGVGNMSARSRAEHGAKGLAAAVRAVQAGGTSKSAPSLARPSTTPGISSLWYDPARRPAPKREAVAAAPKMSALLDDLSWVTSPFAQAAPGPWARAARSVITNTRAAPVPSLELDLLNPNSRANVVKRFKAPIVPSG